MIVRKYIIVLLALTWFSTDAISQNEKQLMELAKKANTNRKFDSVIYYTSKIIELNRSNYEAWEMKSHHLMWTNKAKEGVEIISAFINENPRHVKAYLTRAYVRMGDDNSTKAQVLVDISKAIEMEPSAANYNRRGSYERNFQMFDLAIKDLSQAIKLDPVNAAYYRDRAMTYYEIGDNHLAINDMIAALRIKSDGLYHLTLGQIYNDNGDYPLAIEQHQKALQHVSWIFSGILYVNFVSPYIRLGEYNKAYGYYSEFLKSDIYNKDVERGYPYYIQDFYRAFMEVIGIHIPKGKFEIALSKINYALENMNVQENSATAKSETRLLYSDMLSVKGFVLEKLYRPKEAIDAYSKAFAINKNQLDLKLAIQRVSRKEIEIAANDKEPPVIQIISPDASRGLQITTAYTSVQIVGKAIDPSGISKIFINDKQISKVEDDGLFVNEFTLKGGENHVTVKAMDKLGNVASKSFIVKADIATNPKQDEDIIVPISNNAAPRFFAILIAENEYKDVAIADLENPIKDAKEVKGILQTQYNFEPRNIDTVYNGSREDVMRVIMQRASMLTENDNLLIFYAGHGIAEKDQFGDIEGYWIPSSARKGELSTYISASDINIALKRSRAKHILLIADACFSGAFTRQLSSDASIGVQKQYSVPSRKIMASGNMEPVPDNSRFIFYLKKHLKENNQKYLTAKKLYDGFYEAILNNSDTSPQYAAIKNVGDEGGEFVFIKK